MASPIKPSEKDLGWRRHELAALVEPPPGTPEPAEKLAVYVFPLIAHDAPDARYLNHEVKAAGWKAYRVAHEVGFWDVAFTGRTAGRSEDTTVGCEVQEAFEAGFFLALNALRALWARPRDTVYDRRN